MAITRADTITYTAKKQEVFSDFLDSFAMSPFSGELSLAKNEKSINQSLKNLLLTDFGERLFNPNFGSNANRSLFEMNWEEDLNILEMRIKNAIQLFEPRALLVDVNVRSKTKTDYSDVSYSGIESDDLVKQLGISSTSQTGVTYSTSTGAYVAPEIDDYSVEINVIYTTINNTTPITLTVLLKRVR